MLSTGPSSTTWRTNGEPPSGSWSEDDVLGADVAELHEELIAVLVPATDCLAVPWTTSGSSRTTHQSACALLLSRSETRSGLAGQTLNLRGADAAPEPPTLETWRLVPSSDAPPWPATRCMCRRSR